MKTVKKTSNGVFYVAIALLGVLAIGTGVLAYSVTKNINVQGDYNNYEAVQPADVASDQLGAVSGPDYYLDYQNVNGLVTYVKTGTLLDATTTPVAVKNPSGTTSTIDFAMIKVTGVATSTHTIVCGTSTTAFGSPTVGIIESGSIVTSTQYTLVNDASYPAVSAGALNKIIVGPADYYVCKISSSHTGAFTESTNTYAGKWAVRFTNL